MKIFDIPLPFYAADDGAGGDIKQDDTGDKGGGDGAAGDDKGGDDKGGDKGGDASSFLAGADDAAGDDDKKVVAPADWPEDWKAKIAGEDKDVAKLIERYKSPADVAKALREANKKIGSGKLAPSDEPMPDAEKEPEKAKEWRQARGIPDDPTGYEIPDTIKALITDADKPRLAEFTEHMHKSGVPKGAAASAMEFYFQMESQSREAISAADKGDAVETEEALRAEWGSEFRSNVTLANRFSKEITPGIDWLAARLPDGRKLGSVPEFVKAMADLGSREYGDVAFAGSDNSNKTMARKEELEGMMANDPDRYFADPKLSQEYAKIMEAEEKRSNKR